MKLSTKIGALTAGIVASASASQAAIDPSAVVTEIASNSAGVLAVGGAVLAVVALVLGFRLLRKITG